MSTEQQMQAGETRVGIFAPTVPLIDFSGKYYQKSLATLFHKHGRNAHAPDGGTVDAKP